MMLSEQLCRREDKLRRLVVYAWPVWCVCVYTYAMCVVRCGVVQHLPFIFPEVRRQAVSLCNTTTATAAATTTAAAAAANVFDPV